ncbi:TPA: hypothetical protein ACF33U_004187 [Vibrio parahaemolyticus]
MKLEQNQVIAIRTILATKKSLLTTNASDYSISAIHDLLKGRELSPLHTGKPMNATYQAAIDVVKIIGFKVQEHGSLADWICMTDYGYHVTAEITEQLEVKDLLTQCCISFIDSDIENTIYHADRRYNDKLEREAKAKLI